MSEREPTPLQAWTARAIWLAVRILAEQQPDGIRPPRLWAQMVTRDPGLERDYDAMHTGRTSAFTNFRFKTTGLSKVGWVRKTAGWWYLTPGGRAAVATHRTAQEFYSALDELYGEWYRNRSRYEPVREALTGLPEGYWVAATDLADHVQIAPVVLLHWLQGERPEGWYRVLDRDGGLPDAVPLNEAERREWEGLLEEDDLPIMMGAVDRGRQISGPDLRILLSAIEPGPDAARRAWLVRGSSVQGENLIRPRWLADGIVSLPATRLNEVPEGASLDEIRAVIGRDYQHANSRERARMAAEYHAFLSRMQVDDVVVTNDGRDYFIGVIIGPPAFVTSRGQRANLQRRVHWRRTDDPVAFGEMPDELIARVSNPDAELIELTEFLSDLEALLGEEPEAPIVTREMHLPDAGEGLAEELNFGREWLQECVELLRDRPQLIFYGPPGTGKTFTAIRLAGHLTGGSKENVQLVQFHPAYSYEDFFEGFRPRAGEDGRVAFDLVWGPLRRLAEAARDHPGDPYVLIIDEINRGNLPKIFGELYFLLEYRGESVNLMYGTDDGLGFLLPRNLVIIGTMNTADRSIASLDSAMRRRFAFKELHPSEEPTSWLLREWLKKKGFAEEPAWLLEELNARIADRDFRIGPTYLMRETIYENGAGLDRVWRTQILPLLEEHHYDDGTDVAGTYGLPALRAAIRERDAEAGP